MIPILSGEQDRIGIKSYGCGAEDLTASKPVRAAGEGDAHRWAEVILDVEGADALVNEIRFSLPKGARLTVGDVLLYEPGPARGR